MNVRPELPGDRAASIAVERLAFETPAEPAIVEQVRDLEGAFALVAEDAAEIVGHVQFSRAWVGELPVVALGPIGVRPDRQRQGIGSALVAEGLEEARRRSETAVILLGSPVFYGRRGFVPAAGFGLRNPFAGVMEDGFEIAEEDFQVAVLADPAPPFEGEVRWAPAFDETG
ncbi:MAG: N-acetyltransferase [Actinomycetota bacterium]